ncbi:MAG TPA: HAMP domain-containing sensor histidine kinase [Pyrinomonadaceae bacterium]
MSEKKKTKAKESASKADANARPTSTVVGSGELHTMSAEVIDLLYTQAFAPGENHGEASICEDFSDILLRHWELCCIVTFLRAEDGHLRESAFYIHPHLDETQARRVGELMASVVEKREGECQIWLDETEENDCDASVREVRSALEAAKLKAGVAVPIRVRGNIVGALVAVSASPARLRAALRGVRFIAAPIIIAVGNARRVRETQEQHRRIEQLVEELQQRSAALEEANLELRRVNRYRSLFLARMSHELRTPLTSILGFAEILLDQERLTDPQRRFCEKIQGSGLQLQTSLNQLVDLSRLEAGQTELFLHEFSLRETLRESCAAVGRLAQKQEVKVECCTAPELGSIVSDEGKLRQVLYNFLAHAIGRSPTGAHVKVRVGVEPSTRFRIEITDEGEPLLDPAHIFDPVDLDAPNERGTNMNELGLVIAHRLLGVLGGNIKLDSGAKQGLTVHLELPARPMETDRAGTT